MITQREISQIVGKSGKHERAAARLDPGSNEEASQY